ncbi:hypothetical protein B0H13DRAFT_2367481 [Mycena leptocephala]|nr:hypothetical protein B0H13DRAFT_2367481 [Mycena leptocephala]
MAPPKPVEDIRKSKKNSQYVRVYNTDRISARIPELAPYNFGINQTWFALNKKNPEYAHLLNDWGKYTDPEGFRTPDLVAVDEAGEYAEPAVENEVQSGEED